VVLQRRGPLAALVLRCGWTDEVFRDWLAGRMRDVLLR
jgi:hypothetical protein